LKNAVALLGFTFQHGKGQPGRPLLRLLLGAPVTATQQPAADPALDKKPLLVVRPLFANMAILRQAPDSRLDRLLKGRLGVSKLGNLDSLSQRHFQELHSHSPGRIEPTILVDTSKYGLHGIGQQGSLLPSPRPALPYPQPKVLSKTEMLGMLCENRLANDVALELRQLPFVQLWTTFVKPAGRHRPQNGIAEELQPLVVVFHPLFVRPGGMSERRFEKPRLSKAVAQTLLEPRQGYEVLQHRAPC